MSKPDAEKTREELIEELERLRAVAHGAHPTDESQAVPVVGRLLEYIRALIVEIDGDGRITAISPSVESVLGYTQDEIIGSETHGWVHEADADRVEPSYRDALQGGGTTTVTYRMHHKDGRLLWLETSSVSYDLPDGKRGLTALTRDITAEREALDALRESDLRHKILSAASSDLITETDDEGKFVYLSPTCSDVIGYAEEELLGTKAIDLFHPEDIERTRDTYAEPLARGERGAMGGFRMRHKDGLWRWCEGTGVPYERSDGRTYIVGTLRDVTQRRAAERENARLQERIQRTQRLEGLGMMASGIAHDFNNLLTPILGQSALALSSGEASPEMRPGRAAHNRRVLPFGESS